MGQNNYENEFDRGIFESDRDFDFNEGTTKWQMTKEERQNAIDNALAIGDIEALKELGYDTRYLEFLQQVERAQGNAAIRQAQQAYTAGKSSSSSSKKSSSSKSSGSSSGTKYYKTGDGDNGNEKKIVNQHTEDSVYVAGYGEITNDVLEDYLEKGYIRETVVGNNIYYTAAR